MKNDSGHQLAQESQCYLQMHSKYRVKRALEIDNKRENEIYSVY